MGIFGDMEAPPHQPQLEDDAIFQFLSSFGPSNDVNGRGLLSTTTSPPNPRKKPRLTSADFSALRDAPSPIRSRPVYSPGASPFGDQPIGSVGPIGNFPLGVLSPDEGHIEPGPLFISQETFQPCPEPVALAPQQSDSSGDDSDSDSEGDQSSARSSPCTPRSDSAGLTSWVHKRKADGADPEDTLRDMLRQNNVPQELLWKICLELSRGTVHGRIPRPMRHKLPHVNSLEDVYGLLTRCSNILVLTGAGVSVSAGIPDFRSKGGIYPRLRDQFGMSEPESMFDMEYFRSNPNIFYSFARELWPGKHKPTVTHRFIAALERKGKLLRNYSQNIDGLEVAAGVTKVFQCHGSFGTASCITCDYTVPGATIEQSIMQQRIAYCPHCRPATGVRTPTQPASFGAMKPDIVFFGQDLPAEFDDRLKADLRSVDMVIVMGSSLKVHPVAGIITKVRKDVPMILVNREVVGQPSEFDVELLGDCDTVTALLARRLGWSLHPPRSTASSPAISPKLPPLDTLSTQIRPLPGRPPRSPHARLPPRTSTPELMADQTGEVDRVPTVQRLSSCNGNPRVPSNGNPRLSGSTGNSRLSSSGTPQHRGANANIQTVPFRGSVLRPPNGTPPRRGAVLEALANSRKAPSLEALSHAVKNGRRTPISFTRCGPNRYLFRGASADTQPQDFSDESDDEVSDSENVVNSNITTQTAGGSPSLRTPYSAIRSLAIGSPGLLRTPTMGAMPSPK